MKPSEKERSPNWGGTRPGAGRKPHEGNSLKVLVSLPTEHVRALDDIANQTGESRNSVLRRAVVAFLSKREEEKAALEPVANCDQIKRRIETE